MPIRPGVARWAEGSVWFTEVRLFGSELAVDLEGKEDEAGSGTPRKLFTLAEANALLPSLVPILTRLRDNVGTLMAEKVRLARMALQGGVSLDAAHEAELRVGQMETAIAEDIWMVQALGVELKGIDDGLIDFPTLRDGRVVYLCWRLGEGAITHWHEVDDGFAGRQQL